MNHEEGGVDWIPIIQGTMTPPDVSYTRGSTDFRGVPLSGVKWGGVCGINIVHATSAHHMACQECQPAEVGTLSAYDNMGGANNLHPHLT